MMSATIHTAANGHLTINLNDLPDAVWNALELSLVNDHGFKRVGTLILGAGEKIHPSFVSQEFTLLAGFDNWSGHYLLSETDLADQFLRLLFERGIS